ncbi:MAG: hypothetical protein KGQ28_12210, partial [Hyphomicrobiales bacterium]|nr:hypothetical protein [Hyphomicrobiales bacterium]
APVQAKLAAAMRASAGSAALAPVAAPAPVVSAALGPKAGEAPKATPEATMPTPAPSAPPAVAVASNPDPAAEPANAPAGVGDVTLRGLRALALGDVASARLYLRAAADAGDARATYALGVAYDPLTLKKIGARVETGDSDKAREFYLKALAAGFADARTRLASLSP